MILKILLIDIETAPLTAHVWGIWQQNVGINQIMDSAYTMCFTCKWVGSKEVIFDSVFDSEPKDMLAKVYALVNEADAVVHYNGNKFDMPTLNKEFLLQGFGPPAPHKNIDLLQTVRRQFRFPSNKLDYICQALGLGSKTRHMGHELWVKCMVNDPKAWKIMKRYNIQDVKLLEKLYKHLLPWIKNHPNRNVYNDTERPMCGNCGSSYVHKKAIYHSNVAQYQRWRCNNCGNWMKGRNMLSTSAKRKTIISNI